MCGRFTRTQSWAEVVAFSRLPVEVVAEERPPSWNVAPSQPVMALAWQPDRGYVGFDARWGLRPAWATQAGAAPINARADTVASKPFFRSAFRRHRCLVPANGWYEWLSLADGKQPHYILRRDADPVFFAGIFEPAREPEAMPSVAIVTTEAAAELADLHGRQPVVLPAGDWADWLTLPGTARSALEAMLVAQPEGTFRHYAVSRRVNTPRNDDATLVLPLAPTAAADDAPG